MRRLLPWLLVAATALGCDCAPAPARDGGARDGGASDAGPDAGVDAGVDAGIPLSPAAAELAASTDLPDRVHLAWSLDAGLPPAGFAVFRDGRFVTSLAPGARDWDDYGLDAGEVDPPGGIVAVGGVDGISLSWDAAVTRPGPAARYVLSTEYGPDASLGSNEAVGGRGAPVVAGYEVRRDGGAWRLVVAEPRAFDPDAPRGYPTVGYSISVTVDHARTTAILLADGGVTFSPLVVEYEVRALTDAGASPWSPGLIAAREPTRVVTLQWQRSAADADRDYADLPRVLGPAWFDPEPVLDEGRWYRLAVRVDGEAEVLVPGQRAFIYSVRALSPGAGGPCFVRSDGALGCAYNGGPLNTVTEFADAGGFVDVVAGGYAQRIGLLADGGLWSWDNAHGQANYLPPGAFRSLSPFTGGSGNCAQRVDSVPLCWNENGLLSLPAPFAGQACRELSLRYPAACRLIVDGRIECADSSGALTSPGATTFSMMHVGRRAVCGIQTDGGLWCDDPAFALLSDAGYLDVSTSLDPMDTGGCVVRGDGQLACRPGSAWGSSPYFTSQRLTSYRMGWYYGCGLTPNGRMWCHGSYLSDHAVALPLSVPVRKVAMNFCASLALLESGELEAWGRNLPDGPGMPEPGERLLDVAGLESACAVRLDGGLTCWAGPVLAPPPGAYSAVYGSDSQFCALTTARQLRCFGTTTWTPPGEFVMGAASAGAQCGLRADGGVECSSPAPLAGLPPGPYSAIASGGPGVCGLSTAGAVVCTGGVAVVDGGAQTVGSGGRYVCGTFTDGGVFCNEPSLLAGRRPNLPFKSLFVGDRGSLCGIRPDGIMMCWGTNVEGQLREL